MIRANRGRCWPGLSVNHRPSVNRAATRPRCTASAGNATGTRSPARGANLSGVYVAVVSESPSAGDSSDVGDSACTGNAATAEKSTRAKGASSHCESTRGADPIGVEAAIFVEPASV